MATASLISGNVGNVIVDKGKVEHMYCLIENYPTSHHYLPSPASLNPPSFCPLHSSISTSHSILYPQIIIYSTALPCYISHKDTGIGSKFKLGGGEHKLSGALLYTGMAPSNIIWTLCDYIFFIFFKILGCTCSPCPPCSPFLRPWTKKFQNN